MMSVILGQLLCDTAAAAAVVITRTCMAHKLCTEWVCQPAAPLLSGQVLCDTAAVVIVRHVHGVQVLH
jgi:hypothetical protein